MDYHRGSSQNLGGMRRSTARARVALAALALCGLGMGARLPAAEPPPAPPVPQGTSPAPSGPRIQFVEKVHDFGKVVVGEVLRHTYAFTNAGDGVLEIKEVRSSCGCTASAGWSKRVDPGQGGTIPIELHTSGFNGPVAKQVTVLCNDTSQTNVILQVKATVWHPIQVTPPSAGFRVVSDTVSNTVTVLRITNNEAAPLTLSPPESNQRAIAAELKTIEPGRTFELVVRPVPPLGAGNVFGTITLRTSSTNVPVLSISSWIVVQAAVTVLPTQITVPPGPSPTAFTRDVSIRNLGANPLTLSKPVLDLDGVEGLLTEPQPGRLFTVRLTFPQGFELPAGRSAELRLESNHPQFRVIRVPIVRVPARAPSPAPAVRPVPPATS